MKSAFGSKRKARKIQVDEDDEDITTSDQGSEGLSTCKYYKTTPANPADDSKLADHISIAASSTATTKFGGKAFKKSSLRQSIAFDDQEVDDGNGAGNKPTIGRSNSLMKKKKPTASRLSFGPGEIISGDAAEALEDEESSAPKKAAFGRRIIEGNALRKSLPYQGLAPRDTEAEERPKYSKDYLSELKSSTPTTPKDLQSLLPKVEDEEGLDASELEGAMIVDIDEKFGTSIPPLIPSEAEIREKKERRARLAKEQDFISFNDTQGDDRRQLSHISLLPRKKAAESRLVREDEDLGEGFDEFVEDGRISLGKKQEREARKRQRKEMADMIHQAEGTEDEESDDSEAERRAAYEAAQTRAGMDGLHKPTDKRESSSVQMPSKITPLPVLSECLERLQNTLNSMEQDLARRKKKIEDLRQEKGDIAAREVEVQDLLKQAGDRYAALKADTNGAVADPRSLAEGKSGFLPHLPIDRGLESFGNTPVARTDVEDIG
jgi:hypothetical protein